MKLFNKIKNSSLFLAIITLFFSACNKLELEPVPNDQPVQGTAPTLAALLDDPNFSVFKAALQKAGLLPMLSVPTLRFTIFAPDDAAIAASLPPGTPPLAYIDSLDTPSVKALVSYHIIPQVITSATISTNFPNSEFPSILNPTAGLPSFNPFARLSIFPSRRAGGVWVNNIPVTAIDVQAVNGVLHKVARVVAPPSAPLWSRIATDADLTYLKAAIQRADSGTTSIPGTLNKNNLQSVLTEFGPNLTVFAPSNAAFQATLYAAAHPAVYGQLYAGAYANAVAGGATAAQADGIATAYATANANAATTMLVSSPTVFQNPATFGVLPAQTVKGLLVYHILSGRAFSVNFPAIATNVPTLLNGVVPAHPGVSIAATFTAPVVTAATVKGIANATVANIAVNPLPNPYGTSDQHFFNGVLHKIDQILRPQ